MNHLTFDAPPMDQLDTATAGGVTDWVWDGFFARGDVSLFTGVWKTGKTTLLAGLLHALGGGGTFLGRACATGRAVVVSEEAPNHWADRRRAIPVGPHVRLMSRPFPSRPTADGWDELVRWVEGLRAEQRVDLFAVDPLAAFLPGRSESDTGTLLDFLVPLRRLASGGTAVVVLHHPRKDRTGAGTVARGGGALLGYADALLELHPYGRDVRAGRRRLTAWSRRSGAAADVVYEWTPGTADFRAVPDDPEARFRENWEAVRELLADRKGPVAHKDLLAGWPVDRPAPSASLLYDWLRRAAAAGLAVRVGKGTRHEPFRFALPRPAAPSVLADLPELGPLAPPGREDRGPGRRGR